MEKKYRVKFLCYDYSRGGFMFDCQIEFDDGVRYFSRINRLTEYKSRIDINSYLKLFVAVFLSAAMLSAILLVDGVPWLHVVGIVLLLSSVVFILSCWGFNYLENGNIFKIVKNN